MARRKSPLAAWVKAQGSGSLARLARDLSTSRQRVDYWCKARVPADWVWAVSAATGLTPAQLRPDIADKLNPPKRATREATA